MIASKAISATEKIAICAGGDTVRRVVFQIVDTGSLSTSMVVKARMKVFQTTGINDTELTAVPYVNRGTGATVAASTAITGEGIFEVDATGVEIVLDNTFTSGAGTLYYQPVDG